MLALVKAEILDRKVLVRLTKWWWQLKYRDVPVPISKVNSLRKLVHGVDALFPQYQDLIRGVENLHNANLASQLAGMELGYWSLGVSTINLLEHYIRTLRPKVVLEFGSGVSTACLASSP